MSSESALNKWMAPCRKDDIHAIAAAASPVRTHGVISKPDAGNPSDGVSIYSQSPIKTDAVSCFVGQPALASEGVLKEWMASCRKADEDAIAAAGSPVRIHGADSKSDEGNSSEGASIFSSVTTQTESDHLEKFPESRSDLEQVLTSFGAFCKLMTLRLEADEDAVAGVAFPATSPGATSRPSRKQSDAGQLALASEGVLREWMVICRKTDKDAMAAADSHVRIHGATSKQDTGNPSEGVSIFSSYTSQSNSDHLERFQESRTDLEQVLTSFGAFCKSMTLRLVADEDAVAAVTFPASSPGATSRPSRHLKRVSSADGRSRIQRIRTRRCSSCDGRDARWFDCTLLATDGRLCLSLPEIAL